MGQQGAVRSITTFVLQASASTYVPCCASGVRSKPEGLSGRAIRPSQWNNCSRSTLPFEFDSFDIDTSFESVLRTIARETRALLLQSMLMHRDLQPTLPKTIDPDKPVVVILHGWFATAGALRPLRRRIEEGANCSTASFTYLPGNTLPALVKRLQSLLLRLPSSCPIHLVGHSMGGLVARFFVQSGPGDERVRQTISLASPFFGSYIAHYVPAFLCPDIAPGSPALQQLLRDHEHANHIPHTSIASTHDQLVRPWQSAIYPRGKSIIVSARGHNTLLFDPTIADHVIRAIQTFDTKASLKSISNFDSPASHQSTDVSHRCSIHPNTIL